MKKDCNNTAVFLSEFGRMCKGNYCNNCKHNKNCFFYLRIKPYEVTDGIGSRMISEVQKWSDEHPEQTMAEKFFEMFPNAQKEDDGTPELCVGVLGWYKPKECCADIGFDCEKCWNRPYREVENEVE